jgi:hypothetical protein
MNTPLSWIALFACGSLLAACDKNPTKPPLPTASQPATTPSAANPSAPSAESVFAPGNAATTDPALGKTDGTRKPEQESETKLMPGQNNDHSAPLSTAK